MKLFLDRNKTLLPRIDTIYLLTRMMILVGVAWFVLLGDYPDSARPLMWGVGVTFVLHLAVLALAVAGRFDIKLAYFSAILYDLILIPIMILHTGGMESSYYLLYYLTAAVAAYVLTFWFASAVALICILGYVVAIGPGITSDNLYDVALRAGFVVVCFLAVSYSSEYLRRSEKRILNLFNTLNQRTSELEKSQAQLQMIYENTRILAAILDTDGIVREVVRLLKELLQLRNYSVIFRDKSGSYFFRARVSDGEPAYQHDPVDTDRLALVAKVCDLEEPIRIKDITSRDDYEPLSARAHSVMLVPLVSRGIARGALTAESSEPDHFKERDLQMFSIVARSAALALDNAELHKKTEELTIFDELTQTYNYRYFSRKLDEEKRRAFRYNMPLSLVMVDIDYFKKLNDTYGHENGNRVLRQLSSIIKSCIRDVDIFARYGGEEFAIILPQTNKEEAGYIGERIRSRVDETEFLLEGVPPVRVTVSVGISCFPENGRSPQQLVKIADQALYKAKGDGRNLVRSM